MRLQPTRLLRPAGFYIAYDPPVFVILFTPLFLFPISAPRLVSFQYRVLYKF
jgi:hypothetical protein